MSVLTGSVSKSGKASMDARPKPSRLAGGSGSSVPFVVLADWAFRSSRTRGVQNSGGGSNLKVPPTPNPIPFIIIAVATTVIGWVLEKIFERKDD